MYVSHPKSKEPTQNKRDNCWDLYVKSNHSMDYARFAQLLRNDFRGQTRRLRAQRHVRGQSYSIRVGNDLNNLPADVVNAESVVSFKMMLNNHWRTCNIQLTVANAWRHVNQILKL